MKSSNRTDDLIPIGRIVAAHGLHGVVKVHSYAESAECFSQPEGLILIDPAGWKSYCKVLWVRSQKKGLHLALKDVATREQAEALTGCELLISRKDLPPLEDDSNYWIDLIGMTVLTTDRECLGQIADIIATGANDVYVVATPEGYPVKEILLPAIASVVLEVDVAGRTMVVELPEGLI